MDVFISHVSRVRLEAHALSDALSPWGFDAFVAHDAIRPNTRWEEEIRENLQHSEALIALLTPDFRRSDWCAQEVGAALVSRMPTVVVDLGGKPFGFMASKQMYKPRKPTDWAVVASEVIDLFAEHDVRAKVAVLDAISSMFSQAPTLAVTERMLAKLAYLSHEFDVNTVQWVQTFTKNRFVRRSSRLRRELNNVIKRIPVERLTQKPDRSNAGA